jgi:hypothetical protein
MKKINLITLKVSKKKFLILFFIGLLIRIIGSFGYGDGDMEHFKAWAVLTSKDGIISMYSKSDSEIINYAKEKNISIIQAFNDNRKYINFKPEKKYWRQEYMIMYPPVSEYLLFISGKMHSIFYNNFENNRAFNFFVNLPILILSIIIFLFLSSFKLGNNDLEDKMSIIPFLYWLNPIFILDSPIQGYNNTLIFFLGLLAIYFYQVKKSNFITSIFGTLIFWSKPQGILIFPLICFIIFFTSNSKFRAIKQIISGFSIITTLILFYPLLNGYCISYILGSFSSIVSLDSWSLTLLSARSWNIWWLLSYFDSGMASMEISISLFNKIHNINIAYFSSLIFIFLISYSLFLFYKSKNKSLNYILFLFLSCFSYYNMFMLNVQYNQFIIFIPIVIYFGVLAPELFHFSLVICSFYLLQIFYYGGFGRDIGSPAGLINRLDFNYALNSFFSLLTIIIFIIWFFYLKKIHKTLKSA